MVREREREREREGESESERASERERGRERERESRSGLGRNLSRFIALASACLYGVCARVLVCVLLCAWDLYGRVHRN